MWVKRQGLRCRFLTDVEGLKWLKGWMEIQLSDLWIINLGNKRNKRMALVCMRFFIIPFPYFPIYVFLIINIDILFYVSPLWSFRLNFAVLYFVLWIFYPFLPYIPSNWPAIDCTVGWIWDHVLDAGLNIILDCGLSPIWSRLFNISFTGNSGRETCQRGLFGGCSSFEFTCPT